MKRVLIILVVCLCYQSAKAQLFTKERLRNLENFDDRFLSWGYFLGLNFYDFKFDYDSPREDFRDVLVKENMGFNVGLIGNMRLNNYMDLRFEPGVVFVKRGVVFPDLPQHVLEKSGNKREVTSTYIHLPLLVKFSTKRLNNFKPFVEAGVSTSINLSSNEHHPDDNYARKFRMKTNTYYWELGFGIDLYLYYFKFTPSIRGVFAMSNELVPDHDPQSAYTDGIHKMMSRGIFLNFKFQ